MKVAFIGAGKMAEALIARLTAHNILVSDVKRDRLNFLRAKYKVKVARNNLDAFNQGEVIVLAVKPQDVAGVLDEIRNQIPVTRNQKKLIVSIAAGILLSYLEKKLPGFSLVRAMPNNPCLVGAGITALAKGKRVRSRELGVAREIFEKVGEVVEVPEKWMDAVTGLSGSGPAFVYEIIEALTRGGVASGLPKGVAAKLALQTMAGAAAVIKETGKSPQELIQMVASPGGTTIEGLKITEKSKVKKALAEAVVAAAKKSMLLSKRWAL